MVMDLLTEMSLLRLLSNQVSI